MPPVAPLTPEIYGPLVRAALAEDVGSGDITTEATVPATAGSCPIAAGFGCPLAETEPTELHA